METTQIIVIATILACLNICWGFVSSIQAPFFPTEAENKGASPSQFGPIFGIIHLALFFISPFVGKLVNKFGLRNIYVAGLVIISVSAILFRFLMYVDNAAMFLTLAYVLRILEGIGGAALWTTMVSILMEG